MLAATAAGLAGPYLAKVAIDEGIVKSDMATLTGVVLAFLGIGLLGLAAQALQTYLIGMVGERVLTDLRGDLFARLERLELGFFERSRAGVLISRLTNDIEALQQLVTDGFTSSIQSTLSLFGAAVILLFLDWRLALATLTVFPVMAVATAIFRVYSARAYRRMREHLGEVTAALQEDLTGVRVVQAFRREEQNRTRFRMVNKSYRDANHDTVLSNAAYFPGVELLSALATAVVFGYGGKRTSTARSRSARWSRSSATWPTSSTRSSSSPSSTTPSWPRRRPSTRSSTRWRSSRR
jgi:ATP-binding cassette subfamily B protein